MFIRFVVGMDGEHHRLLTGIFAEARILKDRNMLDPYEEEWLEGIYDWFESYLPCPPFATGQLPKDAVAWFKAESSEFIARMCDISALSKITTCRCACLSPTILVRFCMRISIRFW